MSPPAPKFAPFTAEELCAIQDIFGRIEVVTPASIAPRKHRGETEAVTPWQAVFAVPSGPAVRRFEDAANGDKASAKAEGLRNVCVDAIVALSRNGVKTIATSDDRGKVREAWRLLRETEGFPGAHIAASDAIVALVGMSADEAGKD